MAAADAAALEAELGGADATAIVPGAGTNLPANEMQQAMAARHSLLARRVAEVARLRGELEAALKRQLAAADAALRPLEEQMRRLKDGIWAISLYTGRDEEIVPLRGGEPAPAATPLVIRQLVLAMDEETAVLAGRGGIDFTHLDLVDEWLRDPEHLAQVAPWQRCIVVFRPRREAKNYGDAFSDVAKNEENLRSYWLLRNGERLYRMTTDLAVGDRLVPRRDEFISLFRTERLGRELGHDVYVDLLPGSQAWVQAEQRQDALHRHYMRCALVIQGLLDRSKIFEPFVDGVPFSVLRPAAYDEGKVVIVSDDDTNQLTTGRKPFYSWLAELNARLRPGMRVIGDFNSDGFRRASECGEHQRYWRHSRLSPQTAQYPPSRVVHRLDGWRGERGERGLVFHYARTREEFLRDKDGSASLRVPKTRASCTLFPSDRFILPFDLVSVDEMRTYLTARTERRAYDTMMPLLHAAIAAKEAEEQLEAPFRRMLVGEIARRFDVAIDDDLEHRVNELVAEWKLANRWHRPLVSSALSPEGADAGTEAKAVAAICSAYGQQGGSGDEEAVLGRLLATDQEIMFVGRARTGRYVAYAPQPRAYAPEAAPDDRYVIEYRIEGSTGRGKISSRPWVLPGMRANKLRTLHATERWRSWNTAVSANDCLDDAGIARLAQRAREAAARDGASDPLAITYDHANKTFEIWVVDNLDELERLEPHPGLSPALPLQNWRVSWKHRGGEGPRLGNVWRLGDRWRAVAEVPWGPVWDGVSRHRGVVVLDEALCGRVEAVRAHLIEIGRVSSQLEERVRAAQQAIEAVWRERAEAAAYARFMEDFADPELWPAQREKLRLTYPYRGGDRAQPLRQVLVALVDARVPLSGAVRTLWEAAATLGAVETGACPEDLAELVIDLPVPPSLAASDAGGGDAGGDRDREAPDR